MKGTIRDALWTWGQKAGCYHRFSNNVWNLPGISRMTPAEGAYYMGIPNIIIVRFCNQPSAPFRQHAIPLRPLKRVVWSIIGDSASTDNDRKPDLREVIALGKDLPNLTGGIMDDFFRNDPVSPGRFTAEEVEDFRRQLHSAQRPLDLYTVVYSHDLGLPIRKHLDAVDAITFWTWRARDLGSLENNFSRLEEVAPQKRKLLGIYMWDFGAGAPVAMDAMKHQCCLGLEWLRTGRVEGLVFLATCIADLELEAVEYVRRLIGQVGDELLPDRAKP